MTMEHEIQRVGSVPDMEEVRTRALPELTEGFAGNPELTFAIVGLSGNVYSFGTGEDRAEAEEFCRPGNARDEPLYIFGRPVVAN